MHPTSPSGSVGTGHASSALHRTDGTPVRALVVDDEQALAEAVALALEADGFETRTAFRGRDVLFTAREFVPDVIVLDVMLPDIDGFEVVSRMRDARDDTRVLFLTARDSSEDRVKGLTAGGDDYLTKPFGIDELVARARILARTSAQVSADSDEARLFVGDLQLDENSHEVTRGGATIELTATEFELLRFLMRNPRRVLTREQILTSVWGFDFGASSNLVEMYISYLRRKVDAGREPMIRTVRGTGYSLSAP